MGAIDVFSDKHVKRAKQNDVLVDELYKQIGQLSVERDWLEKNLICAVKNRCGLVDLNGRPLSVRQQCNLLEINRSRLYYSPKTIDNKTVLLINLIATLFMEHAE